MVVQTIIHSTKEAKVVIDPIAHIDSSVFSEVEYQSGNEMIVFCANGRKILVNDVSEQVFLLLQKNPSHESVRRILQSHRWKYSIIG